MKTSKSLKAVKPLLAGTALAMVLSIAIAGPAKADWYRGPHGHEDWRHEDWRHHEIRNHEWYESHRHYVPGYVAVPPPVVYYPPPPPAGINLILPLNFH